MPEELNLIRLLAPDLYEELLLRALLLGRVAALQPIGRRQLAEKLKLSEREVRRAAALLKDEGFLVMDTSGMSVTDKAGGIMKEVGELSRSIRGLVEMEKGLSRLLGVERVHIAAGDADEDESVLADVGKLAAQEIRGLIRHGQTIAVTGGATMANMVRYLPNGGKMNVRVIPARSGPGRPVKTQSNTLAAEMAQKLGGHHRFMYLPEQMDQKALEELMKHPGVKENMDLLQRTDIIIHGVGRADTMLRQLNLDTHLIRTLLTRGAVAEAYGYFFDINGSILYHMSGVGVRMDALSSDCRLIGIAAGKSKAEAIIAVLRQGRHDMIITDEGAAKEILARLSNE